jgi:hypothetical protein
VWRRHGHLRVVLKEIDSHLRLLAAAGTVNETGATSALQSFDQVRDMVWRLLNPV